jgi:(p)ppGpp synthase/HD superfamily hydrolase
MHGYAQTNLQLYGQLLAAERPAQTVMLMARCYEAAMGLFADRFRANGKPFLAHGVGTASILLAHGAPVAVAGAGLLHAAYEQGHMPLRHVARRRTLLRAQVGEEVEGWVQRYAQLAWGEAAMQAMLARADILSDAERELVRMRLANALEDHLDFGLLFCAKHKYREGQSPQAMAALARRLGWPALAAEFEALDQQAPLTVPPALVSPRQASFSAGDVATGRLARAWRSLKRRTAAMLAPG